jgi:hypothetical protein
VKRVLLLACMTLCACRGSEASSGPAGAGSAAPSGSAQPTGPAASAHVVLTVSKEFFGQDKVELKGPAFLDISGQPDDLDYELRIFNAGARDASCDTRLGFGVPIGGDGFALRLQNDRLSPGKKHFRGKPATLDGVRWTLYWPKNGKTTNSGNGAATSAVKVRFSAFGDGTAQGEVLGKLGEGDEETIRGTFTARICKKPEAPPAPQGSAAP